MQRTVVITGSASGIGKATADLCRAAGDRVIGIDLTDAEITADLSSAAGRTAMITQVNELAPNGIDALLAGAGISRPDPISVKVNYFGAVATLEGLRSLLEKSERPRAVAICSTAAILQGNDQVIQACLAGVEGDAVAACGAAPASAYLDSKKALSLWLRKMAIASQWAGAGISLNGIGPGVVLSPMTAPLFDDPAMVAAMARSNPIVTKEYAQPEDIAEVIRFLLTVETPYLLGQIVFVDGGSDAILRPQTF